MQMPRMHLLECATIPEMPAALLPLWPLKAGLAPHLSEHQAPSDFRFLRLWLPKGLCNSESPCLHLHMHLHLWERVGPLVLVWTWWSC